MQVFASCGISGGTMTLCSVGVPLLRLSLSLVELVRGPCHLLTLCSVPLLEFLLQHLSIPLVLLIPMVSSSLLSSTILNQVISASLSSSTMRQHARHSKSIHQHVRHLAPCLRLCSCFCLGLLTTTFHFNHGHSDPSCRISSTDSRGFGLSPSCLFL